jgi:hypothetical protein
MSPFESEDVGRGNEISSSSHFGLTPTKMNPSADPYVWRKQIIAWRDLIVQGAKSSNNKGPYVQALATLSRQLYISLPQSHQQIIENHVRTGHVNFEQEDQVKAVDEIVKIISSEPPMAFVSRLISSLSIAINCKRGPKELLSSFVHRFWGLASAHLLHADAVPDSQTAEILAIILLNNSNLPNNTLTAAKLEIIRNAETRKAILDTKDMESRAGNNAGDQAHTQVFRPHLQLAMQSTKDLFRWAKTGGANNGVDMAGCKHARKGTAQIFDTLTKLDATILTYKPQTIICMSRDPQDVSLDRVRFRLDDAVTVLQGIDQAGGVPSNDGEINRLTTSHAQLQQQINTLLASQAGTSPDANNGKSYSGMGTLNGGVKKTHYIKTKRPLLSTGVC